MENKALYSMKDDHDTSLKFDFKKDAVTALIIAAMCFLQTVALNGFYVEHQFLSGGISGISLLLSYLFEFPTWITILVLNIPICLIGLRFLSAKLVVMSVFSAVVFAGCMALTADIRFHVNDPLLAGIVGAAIIGITNAPVYERNATMGGMDIIASILSKRFSTPVGTFLILFNIVIMGVLGLVYGLELALTSMLAMFISNLAFNKAMSALKRSHMVFIISDKFDSIAPHILKDLHRGMTYIPAQGAYTGAPKQLIYCVVRTAELYKLKRIVREFDPNALVTVVDTKEVSGRGFGALH